MLVIGAGEMGKLTALHLKAQGVAGIVITSRTLTHAKELADEVGGTVTSWDSLGQALVDADIVITATGAPTPILSKATVAAAMPASRTARCSSSTSPCRATWIRARARSSRSSSTTSTICRRLFART